MNIYSYAKINLSLTVNSKQKNSLRNSNLFLLDRFS